MDEEDYVLDDADTQNGVEKMENRGGSRKTDDRIGG